MCVGCFEKHWGVFDSLHTPLHSEGPTHPTPYGLLPRDIRVIEHISAFKNTVVSHLKLCNISLRCISALIDHDIQMFLFVCSFVQC